MSMTNAEVLEGVNEAMRRHGEIMEKRYAYYCDEIRSIHYEQREFIGKMQPTVRELAAIAAMQGLLAGNASLSFNEVNRESVSYADALIAELAK